MKTWPLLADRVAIMLLALTALIMAYAHLFNVFPILIFYALWLPLFFYKRSFFLKPSYGMLAALTLPLIACFSMFWSDIGFKSLYYGLQYAALTSCAVIIARIVSTQALFKGLSAGMCAVLIIAFLSGNMITDYFSGKETLVGFFGSKNVVGLFACLGLFFSVVCFFYAPSKTEKILYGLLPFVISLISLELSRSASSLITVAVLSLGFLCLWLTLKLPTSFRIYALILVLVTGITVLIFAYAFDMNLLHLLLNSVERDPTLTGRTFLWERGLHHSLEQPWLGHGYQAFWQPGNHWAEIYWDKFGIYNKTGFHFHNVYIQVFVDLGLFAVLILTGLFIFLLFKGLFRVLKDGFHPENIFVLGIALIFFSRGVVEVDIFGPNGIGTLLFATALIRQENDRFFKSRL